MKRREGREVRPGRESKIEGETPFFRSKLLDATDERVDARSCERQSEERKQRDVVFAALSEGERGEKEKRGGRRYCFFVYT